jgi:hypothetical protein
MTGCPFGGASMKRAAYFNTAFIIVLIGAFIIYKNQIEPIRESLIFFPIDENASFVQSASSINITEQNDEDDYTLGWVVESTLNQDAYLRHDISLLFEDGRLKDTLSSWKENTKTVKQQKEVKSEDSGHFETISYHHAELHYSNDVIKSAQQMSYDELYVTASPLHPLESFKKASTEKEKHDQQVLDHATQQQLKQIWNSLLEYYNIPVDNYHLLPLSELDYYNNHPFPSMSQEQTAVKIGGLWEGLYKNYLLEIKLSPEKTEDPIGSSMPLVVLSKDASHLMVLLQTKSGENVQLVQY